MKINQDTLLYGSFAQKAGSKGCKLFNTAFNYYGLNAIYKSFSVSKIQPAIAAAKTLNLSGFAISMPFKIDVLDYVDFIEQETETIGASNTIINNDGLLTAYNTDYLAAKTMLSSHLADDTDLYILGDGGYSRAVQQAAKILHCNYTIVKRKHWKDITDIKKSTIYNCTPLENIDYDKSNHFIDCIVSTQTGKELSWLQASHQFKLYTGKDLPTRNL